MWKLALCLFVATVTALPHIDVGVNTNAQVGKSGAQVQVGVNADANLGLGGLGATLGGLAGHIKDGVKGAVDTAHQIGTQIGADIHTGIEHAQQMGADLQGKFQAGLEGAIQKGQELMGQLKGQLNGVQKEIADKLAAGQQVGADLFLKLKGVGCALEEHIRDVMAEMGTKLKDVSGQVQGLLQAGGEQLKAGLDGAVAGLVKGADCVKVCAEKKLKMAKELMGELKGQLEGMAKAGCEESKKLLAELQAKGREAYDQIVKGVDCAAHEIQTNIRTMEEKLKTAGADVAVQLKAGIKALSDKLMELENMKMALINMLLDEGMKLGADVKANLSVLLKNLESGAAGAKEKVEKWAECQSARLQPYIDAALKQLAQLKASASAGAQKMADDLQAKIKAWLKAAEANVTAELQEIDEKLKTAQGDSAAALQALKAKLEAELEEIKKWELQVDVNVNVSVGASAGTKA